MHGSKSTKTLEKWKWMVGEGMGEDDTQNQDVQEGGHIGGTREWGDGLHVGVE